MGRAACLAAVLVCACRPAPAPSAKTEQAVAPVSYLKGQLHAHSNGSGDSATPPADVAAWYAARGYDFIVYTDHNRVTQPPARTGTLLTLPGAELTANLRSCQPPPLPGMVCLLHVNALVARRGAPAVVTLPLKDAGPEGPRRIDVYAAELEVARGLGAVAQLNHPNFHYGADAATLIELGRRGLRLFEVANESVDANNRGDGAHPDTEALWDAALDAGVTLYGTATDDAHHYGDAAQVAARGETVYTGDRGFVMVLARRDADAIREALGRGDFYASSGVLLSRVERREGALEIDVIESGPGRHYRTSFIGRGGRVVAEVEGTRPRLPLAAAPKGHLRAVVRDDAGRRAWVQPVAVP